MPVTAFSYLTLLMYIFRLGELERDIFKSRRGIACKGKGYFLKLPVKIKTKIVYKRLVIQIMLGVFVTFHNTFFSGMVISVHRSLIQVLYTRPAAQLFTLSEEPSV